MKKSQDKSLLSASKIIIQLAPNEVTTVQVILIYQPPVLKKLTKANKLQRIKEANEQRSCRLPHTCFHDNLFCPTSVENK